VQIVALKNLPGKHRKNSGKTRENAWKNAVFRQRSKQKRRKNGNKRIKDVDFSHLSHISLSQSPYGFDA